MSHGKLKLLQTLLRSDDIRKQHRDLMNPRTATRFVAGVREHEDPMDVLFQLGKRDPHLIRTIFTLDSSHSFMDHVVVPFLAWLGQDSLSIGTSSYKQQLICNEMARTPGLLEGLLDALKCDEISNELALIWFLERLILDDGEDGADARLAGSTHSALITRLTRSLTPPVRVQAEKLLRVLSDPSEMAKRNAAIAAAGATGGGGLSLEILEESMPGGRHSNDHVDFRSIAIVPSVDEVLSEKIPFLPTQRDGDVPHVDRQFRLLRHDLVASVIDAVSPLKALQAGPGKVKIPGSSAKGGSRPPLVLERTKRGAILADNSGRAAALLIHFAWPPNHPVSRMQSPKKQREYLQQAKGGRGSGGGGGGGGGRNLLKRGSLIVLTDKSLNPLFFGTITVRDEDLLVDGGGVNNAGGSGRGFGGRGRGGRGGSPRGGPGRGGSGRGSGGRGGRSGHGGGGGGGSWRERQESRPAVGVSFFSRRDLEAALLLSRDDAWGCLVPLTVGVFAYESVLKKLQSMVDVPMRDVLVDWPAASPAASKTGKGLLGHLRQLSTDPPLPTPPLPLYEDMEAEVMEQLAERFAPSPDDLQNRTPLVLSPPLPGVTLPAGCQFDISQRAAVAQVLRQRVSLVQGPPGTGKTFLGVLLAQTILSHTAEKILCVCYTNHALDSFLEDMLGKGVTSMVRIGGGSKNPKLDRYQLRSQQAAGFDRVQNRRFAHLKGALEESQAKIDEIQRTSRLNSKPDKMAVLTWLEDEGYGAFQDLQMPEGLRSTGETVVGRKGRALTSASIVQNWLDGKAKPSSLLRQPTSVPAPSSGSGSGGGGGGGIWAMDKKARKAAWAGWEAGVRAEAARRVAKKVAAHDMYARELSELQLQKDLQRVRGARIVGCTTTGAAIHHALLAEAGCGVVLVEEAAEVLEAHVLTALKESTKHLIMIGDHKQLRPKVEQYSLRVESGRGFDLNVSLFERLVKGGYPHTTLELQHRMPPEISSLVRGLTYPGLRDGPGTANRPPILGVRDRVCFVAHRHREETMPSMRQRQDDGVSASKINNYEVRMVAKTVKYLLLQGYEPDQLVVLTPYLAQLRELRDALDGSVSAQDASDLAAAVRLGDGNTDGNNDQGGNKGGGGGIDARSRVRVATVDNYQGEENDVVILSFVRSNDGGQMGFVGDPNRLNVSISRARHGMILFGDIDFFTSDSIRNKSGQRLWLGFAELLEAGGHVYRDGLPVVCETHKTHADLATPEAFDEHAPDGGCRVVCGAKLKCAVGHTCPRRCHPGDDKSHEKAPCVVVVEDTCSKGHKSRRRCSKDPAGLPCQPCERETAVVKREIARHAESKAAREREREAATARLAEARRAAALERDTLAHEAELLRLERETQRALVDAERARASLQGARAAKMQHGAGGATGAGAAGNSGRKDEHRGGTAKASSAAVADKDSNQVGKAAPSSRKTSPKADKRKRGIITPAAPQASTLLLVAQAAAKGDARGITDALQAVTQGEQRDQTSHALAVAIGEPAYEWFPPGSGGESSPVGPPTPRAAQALDLMASGEWVKARVILTAIVQGTGTKKGGVGGDSSDPSAGGAKKPTKPDPFAVYGLALCDQHITGGGDGCGLVAAKRQLDGLDTTDLCLWPGPPDGRPLPDARAFPLGALVRAHLLTASAAPSSTPQQEGTEDGAGGIKESPTQDPRVRACSLAVSFLRAPAHARKVGNVNSPAWIAAVEALVRENGRALARELWGPEGDKSEDNGEKNGALARGKSGDCDDRLVAEWQRLQARWAVSSGGMDSLLEMSGLGAIKAHFLSVAKLTILDKERGYDPASRSFNLRLEGNPGTGKTTVARLYYRLLKDLGVFSAAQERAQEAKAAAEAAEQRKADAAEAARQDAERRAFQSAGLPYTQSAAKKAPAPAAVAAASLGSWPSGFVETTGAALVDNGVRGLKGILDKIRQVGGGVLFVDEAYTLEPQGGGAGKQVLNFLLAEIENRRGELVVAFAGYAKNMEALFEFNEGLTSRFPKTLIFEDYDDALLLDIFKGLMEKKTGLGTLRFATDPDAGAAADDRWARVAIARLGRRRGTRGFGNARTVRALFDKAMERQAGRLSSVGNGDGDDDLDPYELRKSDLLGTSVASLDESEGWRTLRDMIGLGGVKEAVRALAEVVETNRVLEEAGKSPRGVALNRCMLGNPGTGKTTVAKLFAGILADLGLLSKGEVVLKTASDFVGSALGESETKTRAILKASEGCVLVIDEAYSLSATSGVGSGGGGDPYRTAVVDTLVEQVQNVPGEDRCVLLLGYRAEMEAFMRDTNPGLARRFALDNSFAFEDYTDEELVSILRGKLRREHLTAGADALVAAANVLARKRATASHFGNGGEVANLLSEAKLRKENRRGDGSVASRLDPELLPQDFDPEYGAGPPDGATLEEDLFGDLIGCDDIKLQLKKIRKTFIHAKRVGSNPREVINMNFRFTGAPGTGKTTVAHRAGRMFKRLGAIHSDEVVSCSPSDFSTGFVGQAAKKTKEIMDKAVGKVLFIDEAYGLNPRHGGGVASFMQEVVDQLVQCLTDDKYKGKMVVVVAGYAQDIDELMEANPGLASRFPETLHFKNFGVDDCCRLLETSLKKVFGTELSPEAEDTLRDLLPPIVQDPRFGNGRCITDLAKRVFTEVGMRIDDDSADGRSGSPHDERVSAEDIRRSAAAILQQMTRVGNPSDPSPVALNTAFDTGSQTARKVPTTTTTTTNVESPEKVAGTTGPTVVEETDGDHDHFLSVDDLRVLQQACEVAGIPGDSPDTVLKSSEALQNALQLSAAKGGVGLSRQETQAFLRKVVDDRAALSRAGQEAAAAAAKLSSDEADAKAHLEEAEAALSKEQEDGDGTLLDTLMRVKRAKARVLQKAKAERERKLASEAASQAALRRMGVCPAGYQWNRQGGGWRCAGGSHYVSGGAVAAEMARGLGSSG